MRRLHLSRLYLRANKQARASHYTFWSACFVGYKPMYSAILWSEKSGAKPKTDETHSVWKMLKFPSRLDLLFFLLFVMHFVVVVVEHLSTCAPPTIH